MTDRSVLCPSLAFDLVAPVTCLMKDRLGIMTWLVGFSECPECPERQGHRAQGHETPEHPDLLRQRLQQAEHTTHTAAAEDWCVVVFLSSLMNPLFVMILMSCLRL